MSKLLFIKLGMEEIMVVPLMNLADCAGGENILCSSCNANQEPGFCKENQMTQRSACYGRSLIAHKDGSNTICVKCNGKGKLPCATCGSWGLITFSCSSISI